MFYVYVPRGSVFVIADFERLLIKQNTIQPQTEPVCRGKPPQPPYSSLRLTDYQSPSSHRRRANGKTAKNKST